MSGCHPTHEDEDFQNVSPIMKMIQDLMERVRVLEDSSAKQWDLSYKADENLSKRLEKLNSEMNVFLSRLIQVEESYSGLFHDYNHLEDAIAELRSHETEDHDERIHDLENIGAEQRLVRLESERLTNQLDPKVWAHVAERLDKLESMTSMLDLMIKAKEFGVQMAEGNRYMECLAGLENKLNDKIIRLEERYKFVPIDYQNMRKELSETYDRTWEKLDYLKAQIEVLFDKLKLNMRNKVTCRQCEGNGTIYISPISDCGQSNKCPKCHGDGWLWI